MMIASGVARILLRGNIQGIWGTEIPQWVQDGGLGAKPPETKGNSYKIALKIA